MRSEGFTVVYIDDLTKCHCLNSALRLTLTKSTKRKNKQKAERKQTKKYEKDKQKRRFLLKWKEAFKWLDTAY